VKKPSDIRALVQKFEAMSGQQVADAPQGTGAWQFMKLGVLSASNASRIVAKKDSETRATYMAELIAQVCTGQAKQEFESRPTEWGKQHEDAARACYEFTTGNTVTQLPFVYRDETFRVGCSPDGIVGDSKGAEIKVPYATENYIKFLALDKIKGEYAWQTQFTLWVMDADEWDFVQYDPRMKVSPMKILPVQRDAEKFKTLDELVPAFIDDMDAMLSKIGAKFGDQWKPETK